MTNGYTRPAAGGMIPGSTTQHMKRLLLFLIPVAVIAAVVAEHGRCADAQQSTMPVCE